MCTFLTCQGLLVAAWSLSDSCALCEVASNLLLVNGAFCHLLLCIVPRLNSASYILAKSSVQERRFLLKIMHFPRNFYLKANSYAFSVTYCLLISYGIW